MQSDVLRDLKSQRRHDSEKFVGSRSLEGLLLFVYSNFILQQINFPFGGWRRGFSPSSSVSSSITRLGVILCLHLSSLTYVLSFIVCCSCLCKSSWLNQSKIRLDRSKVVQIVFFLQNFQLNLSPFDVQGFMLCFKYKKENPSHVFRQLLMLCAWIFCEIKRWLPSHILMVSKIQDYVKNLMIDSVVTLRA